MFTSSIVSTESWYVLSRYICHLDPNSQILLKLSLNTPSWYFCHRRCCQLELLISTERWFSPMCPGRLIVSTWPHAALISILGQAADLTSLDQENTLRWPDCVKFALRDFYETVNSTFVITVDLGRVWLGAIGVRQSGHIQETDRG